MDEMKGIEVIDFILNQNLNKIKKEIIQATENPLDIYIQCKKHHIKDSF